MSLILSRKQSQGPRDIEYRFDSNCQSPFSSTRRPAPLRRLVYVLNFTTTQARKGDSFYRAFFECVVQLTATTCCCSRSAASVVDMFCDDSRINAIERRSYRICLKLPSPWPHTLRNNLFHFASGGLPIRTFDEGFA